MAMRVGVIVAALCGGLGCGPADVACPGETVADAERAREVLAAAGRTRVGRSVALDGPLCFGGSERGALLPGGEVVIAERLVIAEAAARAIHLNMHRQDGLHRFPRAGVACERQLADVTDAEARAIVAELEACAELECAEAPYSFAGEVLALAPADRGEAVRTRLRAEPTSDGLAAMMQGYRRRCEAALRGAPTER